LVRNAEFSGSFSISNGVFMFHLLLLRWGVAVLALFSVIFITWRWLFSLLGGG
jgi:hypothetical protein